MQVVHKDDHITHAVIGGGTQINFGITDDPMFMQMLSSTLYSDQKLAVVRETVCNAWDAHIDAQCTNLAIEITITDTEFVIRDFGLGISKEMMGPIYAVYGSSTKKNDDKSTGGFGLGCKSPFAYTDHFEVTSCHNGTKTIYNISKSSAELEGKPGIVPIVSVPTDETGLTVRIGIKSRDDAARFRVLTDRIINNGEIKAMVNGREAKVTKYSEMENNYLITTNRVLEDYSDHICIRYGNVIYPLASHTEYADAYDEAEKFVSELSDLSYTLVLQAPPGSLSITPSRESISMQAKTIKTVTELLRKFLAHHHEGFNRACKELVVAKTDELIKEKQFLRLLTSPNKVNLHISNGYLYNRRVDITNTAEAASSFMHKEYPKYKGFLLDDMSYRLKRLAEEGPYEPTLLKSFRKELVRTYEKHGSTNVETWFAKNILWPLKKGGREMGLENSRYYVHGKSADIGMGSWNWEMIEASRYEASRMSYYLLFLRRIVVLTHSKNNVHERLRHVSGFEKQYGSMSGLVVYVVPRRDKAIKAARDHFHQTGFTVIDLTREIEAKAPSVRSSKTAGPKKKPGYPLLSSAMNERYERFQHDCADSSEERLDKPKFFTYLNSRSSHSSEAALPDFTRKTSKAILALWGNQGVVIKSSVQEDKLRAKGVLPLDRFVYEMLTKDIVGNKAIAAHMGTAYERVIKDVSVASGIRDIVEVLWQVPSVQKKLKLNTTLPEYEQQLLDILEDIESRTNSVRDALIYVRSIPASDRAVAFIASLDGNKLLHMLDTHAVNKMLKSKNEDEVASALQLIKYALKG